MIVFLCPSLSLLLNDPLSLSLSLALNVTLPFSTLSFNYLLSHLLPLTQWFTLSPSPSHLSLSPLFCLLIYLSFYLFFLVSMCIFISAKHWFMQNGTTGEFLRATSARWSRMTPPSPDMYPTTVPLPFQRNSWRPLNPCPPRMLQKTPQPNK